MFAFRPSVPSLQRTRNRFHGGSHPVASASRRVPNKTEGGDFMRRRIVSERLLVVLVAVAMASLALPSAARAQAVYGSIAGTVQDSTGAALPGVSVTITSVERKTTDTVVSNGSGLYTKD